MIATFAVRPLKIAPPSTAPTHHNAVHVPDRLEERVTGEVAEAPVPEIPVVVEAQSDTAPPAALPEVDAAPAAAPAVVVGCCYNIMHYSALLLPLIFVVR